MSTPLWMNQQKKTVPVTSFFDFQRAATGRETPAVRLRQAAIDGNIPAVKRLIKKVPNIQNPDPSNNYTTLMYAARHGHVELVELLLNMNHEEEVISVDNKGETVLMIAAMYNHEEIFYNYASRYQECVHAISKNGWTALLYAAKNGNANLVNYMKTISADIDHVDYEGNSALHYASAWGHTAVMELLASLGCNLDLENNSRFSASDYAYSFSVKEHMKTLPQVQQEAIDASLSSSFKQSNYHRPCLSSLSSGTHPSLGTTLISRGPSYSGYESPTPTPRASTSSSSIVANSVSMTVSSSPRGSYFQQAINSSNGSGSGSGNNGSGNSGSGSSNTDGERQRAASFGDQARSLRFTLF
ncbi:ankyrin repeat-containing domain protein [Phycomyces blakesleeanus]|uniref:Ankyrin repeat-containing domain protein n=1 Tax=Phycomyces blakesleeanus TaxID=4837 RepID=A0ABR3B8S2_PHYBL